jgi:6-hydroxynicotinate 3-monooxygenase
MEINVMPHRIAIVGGGLGGTLAGILLQRAGHHVQIYEQAPQLARVGAGINLGANVMTIMRHVGLEARMNAIGLVPQTGASRVWDTGEVLFQRPYKEWAARFGAHHLIMHRGDLLEVLSSALQPGTLNFGKQLAGLTPSGGGTRLEFADGSQTEADLVIGADGVNSKVREILLGPEPPIYTGTVAYRAIFPASLLAGPKLANDSTKWWSDERLPAREDRHFIIYHLTAQRDEIYFVTGSPEPHWDGNVASVPAPMQQIRACYEGFHPEVIRVIEACPEASKWPLLERAPRPVWSRDGIVLLGDACHPMKPHMGQGAAMAFEDAVILARSIDACGPDASAAFRLYESTRIERTSRVQRESHDNTWLRDPSDPAWVFGYDALTTPLKPPAAASNAAQ